MTEKNSLMNKIRLYDFILTEMVLYLDTHPNCANGLAYFKKYKELSKTATDEYSEKFGPISIKDSASAERWKWTDDPWPWEKEANI